MSATAQRSLTPEEKIADLYSLVKELRTAIDSMEETIYDLRHDVNRKAGENHSHYDLERQIRDTEYHTHHDYASNRHTHDRWDLR